MTGDGKSGGREKEKRVGMTRAGQRSVGTTGTAVYSGPRLPLLVKREWYALWIGLSQVPRAKRRQQHLCHCCERWERANRARR